MRSVVKAICFTVVVRIPALPFEFAVARSASMLWYHDIVA